MSKKELLKICQIAISQKQGSMEDLRKILDNYNYLIGNDAEFYSKIGVIVARYLVNECHGRSTQTEEFLFNEDIFRYEFIYNTIKNNLFTVEGILSVLKIISCRNNTVINKLIDDYIKKVFNNESDSLKVNRIILCETLISGGATDLVFNYINKLTLEEIGEIRNLTPFVRMLTLYSEDPQYSKLLGEILNSKAIQHISSDVILAGCENYCLKYDSNEAKQKLNDMVIDILHRYKRKEKAIPFGDTMELCLCLEDHFFEEMLGSMIVRGAFNPSSYIGDIDKYQKALKVWMTKYGSEDVYQGAIMDLIKREDLDKDYLFDAGPDGVISLSLLIFNSFNNELIKAFNGVNLVDINEKRMDDGMDKCSLFIAAGLIEEAKQIFSNPDFTLFYADELKRLKAEGGFPLEGYEDHFSYNDTLSNILEAAYKQENIEMIDIILNSILTGNPKKIEYVNVDTLTEIKSSYCTQTEVLTEKTDQFNKLLKDKYDSSEIGFIKYIYLDEDVCFDSKEGVRLATPEEIDIMFKKILKKDGNQKTKSSPKEM